MAEEWYFASNGQANGPVSVQALRAMAQNGGLAPSDLVWTSGMSDWVPASTTRGLFPKPVQVTKNPAPVQPALEQRTNPPVDSRPSFELQRRPGLNKNAKVGLIVVVAAAVGLTMVLGIAVIIGTELYDATSAANHPRGFAKRRNQGNNWVPPPVPQQAPARPAPPPIKDVEFVPVKKKYVVELRGQDSADYKKVILAANKEVTIRVTTTVPPGQPAPDVDLYLWSSGPFPVACDTLPDKDCVLTFTPRLTEFYIIDVHLCEGASAHCVVEFVTPGDAKVGPGQ
jgi:hypothetical protein